MGDRLITAAYGFVLEHNAGTTAPGGILGPVELAVFGALALRADDATAVVEGPRDELCTASGIPATEAGRKRLQRAVRALAASGGLSVVGHAHRGSVSRFRLALQSVAPPPAAPPVSPKPSGDPSPFCAAHPTGTVSPCAACGVARRAALAARRARRRRFHDCAVDGHVPVVDGSCMYCTELRSTPSL